MFGPDEAADVFPAAIQAALDTLPEELREAMSNVEILVEDQSPRGPGVLGLYEGIPLTKRGAHYNMTLPDRIAIFRGPLQRISIDETDLSTRIAHVVRHEIAHYFGISDDRLREIDAY